MRKCIYGCMYVQARVGRTHDKNATSKGNSEHEGSCPMHDRPLNEKFNISIKSNLYTSHHHDYYVIPYISLFFFLCI